LWPLGHSAQKNYRALARVGSISIILAGFLIFPGISQAVFDLSVTQIEGGFDLKFDKIETTDFKAVRQMRVRVNSDTGKPYRVFQQIIQPPATDQGRVLNPDQFKMYALQGSNSQGALIYRPEEPVSQAQTLVYTSNASGGNDTFQLVYTVTPKADQVPGSYYGRMSFILVPVDMALSQVVVNVQIYIELAAGSSAAADIVTNTGTDRIEIDTEKLQVTREGLLEGTWPQVHVKVSGPVGASYRIYQALEAGDVTSAEGYDFDLETITVNFSGARQGMLSAAATLREARQRQLIYTSDPQGASDEVTITYKPTENFRLSRAGLYRGRLVIFVESDQMGGPDSSTKKTLDVVLNVAPLFDIRVYSQDVEGVALRFGDVNYKGGPKSSENEIFVETNLGKPYGIIVKVGSPMVNQEGDKVPPEDFVMKVKDVVSEETPKSYAAEFVPVQEGEHPIFSSGSSGKSARMKVEYRLTMRPESRAGNYNTQIGYSLVLD
jgi:hypothetical protein